MKNKDMPAIPAKHVNGYGLTKQEYAQIEFMKALIINASHPTKHIARIADDATRFTAAYFRSLEEDI